MWGWVSALAVAALLTAAVASLGAPEAASARHQGRDCGIVSKGERDYRVRAQQLSCDKAVRGANRYLRSGSALAGFACDDPAGRIQFFCKSDTKVYWAVRL
jgi:hypothetical protein